MLTLITPCARPQNLEILRRSIDMDLIQQWIIVHDTAGQVQPVFDHPKILEIGHPTPPGGCAGHAQRNAGMKHVKYGLIYFLDDDNIIHPTFWDLVPTFEMGHFYTFDQQRWDGFVATLGGTFKGDTPRLRKIDTAQYVVDIRMTRPFEETSYVADGLFIEDIYLRFNQEHIYHPVVACYYNYLRRT